MGYWVQKTRFQVTPLTPGFFRTALQCLPDSIGLHSIAGLLTG
jgi:hypothetical protein